MSKKNKSAKLVSKTRNVGKSYLVSYNGVEMTRAEREALIRENQPKQETVKSKKVKKGTKVAEPSHSRLFNLLHPGKKQTSVPDLVSVNVEDFHPEEKKEKFFSRKAGKPAAAQEPVINDGPVKEEPADVVEQTTVPVAEPESVPEVEPGVESEPEAVQKPVAEPEPEPAREEQEQPAEDEEDDNTEEITVRNARRRINPLYVKKIAQNSAKGCDDCVRNIVMCDKQLEKLDRQISSLKAGKNSSEEEKASFAEKRKVLRDEKATVLKDRNIAKEKAVALERAADGYSGIYSLLTGNELSLRKTDRINEYEPLSAEQEQEVLELLWSQKGARK